VVQLVTLVLAVDYTCLVQSSGPAYYCTVGPQLVSFNSTSGVTLPKIFDILLLLVCVSLSKLVLEFCRFWAA
jgi:hypothetical protein